jgi:hypothetical protein
MGTREQENPPNVYDRERFAYRFLRIKKLVNFLNNLDVEPKPKKYEKMVVVGK